jgi:hypothetical protein
MSADLIAELREAAKVERENACEQDFWHEELLLKAADALEAALSERDALLREEECHDEELHGWEQDLAQERALREASEARVTALEKALASIQWKSADRDNMEFTARITCYQMDALLSAKGGET